MKPGCIMLISSGAAPFAAAECPYFRLRMARWQIRRAAADGGPVAIPDTNPIPILAAVSARQCERAKRHGGTVSR